MEGAHGRTGNPRYRDQPAPRKPHKNRRESCAEQGKHGWPPVTIVWIITAWFLLTPALGALIGRYLRGGER